MPPIPHRHLILLCALFLLTPLTGLILGSSASAQVILRDTVRIGSFQITDAINPCTYPPLDLFIVAPRDGVLRFRGALGDSMWGYEKFQLGSPPAIVLNQRMEFIHSDTTYTTSFSPIVSSWTTEPGWSLAR